MPTCSKNQFWDPNANSCQSCHSSCGSCSGPGSSSCLSCSNANDFVLRTGSCVTSLHACAGSANTTTVLNPFGVCFSELITIPSETNSLPPMPTVTGIDRPIITVKSRRLEWWQILLMALGCTSIFIVVIWCCRRKYRKRKEEERRRVQAYAFVNTPEWRGGGEGDKNYTPQSYHLGLDSGEIVHTGSPTKDKDGWKWRLIKFGEKFFGHSESTRIYPMEMGCMSHSGKPIALLSDPLTYSPEASAVNGYHYSHDSDHDTSRQGSPRPVHSHNEHPMDVPMDVQTSETLLDDAPAIRHPDHHRDIPSHRGSSIRDPIQGHQQSSPENEEDQDMVQLISSYRYSVTPKTPPVAKANHFHHNSRSGLSTPSNGSKNDSRTPLLPQPYYEYRDDDECYHDRSASHHHPVLHHSTEDYQRPRPSISTDSMYSPLTGHTRRMPDARQPVRDTADSVHSVPELKSKFSMSTIASSDSHRQARHSGKLTKKLSGSAGGLFWK